MRFAITGSGRCGTTYLSHLLTAAGIYCGHEQVYTLTSVTDGTPPDWGDFTADSSWMALAHLPLDVPLVLITRHPLAVVASYMEIGYFTTDLDNPCHEATATICPAVYDEPTPQDAALRMWLHWNTLAAAHAELRFHIEHFTAPQLRRLLGWAGGDPHRAPAAITQVAGYPDPRNRLQRLRDQTQTTWTAGWEAHRPDLAAQARELAAALGYDPEVVP